jgi:hypothetical protein
MGLSVIIRWRTRLEVATLMIRITIIEAGALGMSRAMALSRIGGNDVTVIVPSSVSRAGSIGISSAGSCSSLAVAARTGRSGNVPE